MKYIRCFLLLVWSCGFVLQCCAVLAIGFHLYALIFYNDPRYFIDAIRERLGWIAEGFDFCIFK